MQWRAAPAASETCRNGRHWRPPKTVTSPSLTAFAVMRFTTRSNRGRGDNPYRVPNRMMQGANELSARPISNCSESALDLAYTDTGASGEPSARTPSLAP